MTLNIVVDQHNMLLSDVYKASDKVAFNVLFSELRDRSMCSRIPKLLHYTCMHINQSCYGNQYSDSCFNVS